jgi:hypothetical protein
MQIYFTGVLDVDDDEDDNDDISNDFVVVSLKLINI